MSIRRAPNNTREIIEFPGSTDVISTIISPETHDALGDNYLHPTAIDNVNWTSPTYEDLNFKDFVKDVVSLDVFTGEVEPEFSISESGCQICFWVKIRVSIWAQATGWGFCYVIPECREEEPLEIPPPVPPPPNHSPPPVPPPPHGKICCIPRSLHLSGVSQTNYYDDGAFTDYVGNLYYPAGCYVQLISRFTGFLRFSQTSRHTTASSWYKLPSDKDRWEDYIGAITDCTTSSALVTKQQELRQQGYTIFGTYEYISLKYPADEKNPGGSETRFTSVLNYSANWEKCTDGEKPSPPPPPPEDEDMNCCRNQRDNEELLRKIAAAVGVGKFPVSLPTSYLNSISGSTSLGSIPEIQVHQFKNNDAVLGSFPLDIEFEDIDPESGGNQKRKISIENLAEGIAELFALGVKTSVDADNVLEGLLRLIPEVLSTKAAVLIAQSYAKANADFLGYRGNETTWNVPINFKSDLEGAENLKGLFRKSTAKIKVFKNEEKASMLEYLQRLMFAAGLVKEQFLHKDSSELAYSLEDEIAKGGDVSEDFQLSWDRFIELLNTDKTFNRSEGAPRPKAREVPFVNPDPS